MLLMQELESRFVVITTGVFYILRNGQGSHYAQDNDLSRYIIYVREMIDLSEEPSVLPLLYV